MPETSAPSLVGRSLDYVVGRSTLIGVASIMLVFVTGYAGALGRDGYFSYSAGVLLLFVALSFVRWLMLRETLSAGRYLWARLITGPVYLIFAMLLGCFGYGFWWSTISGEETTRTAFDSFREDARNAAAIATARLDAALVHLNIMVKWSSEGQVSPSCGGVARRTVRDSVSTLRESLVRSWLTPVKADVERLRQAAAQPLIGRSPQERRSEFEARKWEIRSLERALAARSDELAKWAGSEMHAVAVRLTAAPGSPGFLCYDPTLSQLLRDGAAQAGQPLALKLRDPVFNEGPAGIKSTVDKVWRNIASVSDYVLSGRKETASQTDQPMTGRDLIALLVALGTELGLLALAVINPPRERPMRA